MMVENEIELRNVTKVYGRLVAVQEVSFAVPQGIVFGLLGPNGAGKTTLVNILTTLLHPTSGLAFVGGHDVVREAARIRSLIGVVPQENNLDRYLTARENLILHAKMHRMPPSSYQRRIDELLDLMGLSERQKDFPNKFSTGMQRRLVVVRALVHDPRILFLDEPTTGLDPQAKRMIWDYFLSLKGKRTIFLTTHNMEEADFLCDQITILDHGSPIVSGTSSQLKEMAASAWFYEIEVAGRAEEYLQAFQRLPFIESASLQDGVIQVCLKKEGKLGSLVEQIDLRDLRKISSRQPSLEDVFLKLTGRSLRV
ncbi:MAG: ABC transporter ATP-binding protein [Deltaproteobacteria bacterium]|jgi:ABC-2 type transport system ATP-binding protein|nr:ABC transporter ATP-binding protein [Deltaproteobacteria bacterium]